MTSDDVAAQYALMRNRAKDAEIGASVKTVDWYRHHYGDEFSTNENREWWSIPDNVPSRAD